MSAFYCGYCGFVKSVGRLFPAVGIVVKTAILLSLFSLVACSNSIVTGGYAELRSVVSSTFLVSPLAQTVSINQNGPETMVPLPYESREGGFPVACKLDSPVNVLEVTSCACAEKLCQVGIQAPKGVHGDGSFTFRLIDELGLFSEVGSMKVRILPVTISVASGGDQEGLVGKKLSSPLVALVQNSDGVPVSGVEVSWKTSEGGGQICDNAKSSKSDEQGKVQCDWALGEKLPANEILAVHHAEASIFDSDPADDLPKDFEKPAPARFAATVKSGPAVRFAFLPDQYPNPKGKLMAGESLGAIGIYPRDEHGNLTQIEENFELTLSILSLDEIPEGGGSSVPSRNVTSSISSPWKGGEPFGDKGLQIERVGTYSLAAFSSGLPSVEKADGEKFTVISGRAAKLVFVTEPGGAVAAKAFIAQPVVMVQDTYGNLIVDGVDSGAQLTISLDSGTGVLSGGVLSVRSVFGVAAWNGLLVGLPGPKRLKVVKADLTSFGGSGVLSAASSVFESKENPPPVVTNLQARTGNGAVSLTWTASSGATSYNVLRGTSPGSLVSITTTQTTAYTDPNLSNGTLYYYAVEASSALGTSAGSSLIQAEPLSVPSIASFALNYREGPGALDVTWNESVGASDYRVRYSTRSGSASQGTEACRTRAPEKKCTVSNLIFGTQYYFVVNAANDGFDGVNSKEEQIIPRGGVPEILSLESEGNQVKVKFKSKGGGPYSATVRYGTTSDSYTSSLSKDANDDEIATVVASNLTPKIAHYFRVEAKYPGGGLFLGGVLRSTEKTATPDGRPGPFNIISAGSGNGAIRLTWGASSGADNYTVKYGMSSGSHSTTFAERVEGTSIKITGLTEGTTYYFMVIAANRYGWSRNAEREFVKTLKRPEILAKQSFVTPTVTPDWQMSIPLKLVGEEFSGLSCEDIKATYDSNDLVGMPFQNRSMQGRNPDCRYNFQVKGKTTGTAVFTFSVEKDSDRFTRDVPFVLTPAASLAYSTRLIVLGYSGKAMQVERRGIVADVAFDGAGRVSPSSLVTIVSSSYGGDVNYTVEFSAFYRNGGPEHTYVRYWYDQSGNGNHAFAWTAGKQPYIVKGVATSSGIFQDTVSFETAKMLVKYKKDGSLDFNESFSISAVFSDRGAWGGGDGYTPEATLFTQRCDENFFNWRKREWESLPITLGIITGGYLFGVGTFNNRTTWWTIPDVPFGRPNNERMIAFGSYDGVDIRFSLRNRFGDKKKQAKDDKNVAGQKKKSEKDFYIGAGYVGGYAFDENRYLPMNLDELVVYKSPLSQTLEDEIKKDQAYRFPLIR